MSAAAFYMLAAALCVFAVLSVAVKDVFHGALWLAFVLLSVAGVFFTLGAGFLGVVQILVYVGGIMTLFVFAIKLTAKIGDTTIRQVNRQVLPAAVISSAIFAVFLGVISGNPWNRLMPPVRPDVDIAELGRELLTTYMLPFEFISVLLLAALVGAIVIGKVKK